MQSWSNNQLCQVAGRVAWLYYKMMSQANRMTLEAQRQCVACIPFAVKHESKHSINTSLQPCDIETHSLRHGELLNSLQSLLQANVHAAYQIIICNAPFALVLFFFEARA